MLTGGLFLALCLCAAHIAAADEKESKPEKAGKGVSIEILIADLVSGQAVGSDEGADPTPERILELEKQGKLPVITRIRLATLENIPGMVQFGERVGVESARNFTGRPAAGGPGGREGPPGGFGGGVTSSFTYQNVGTLVSATPRVEQDGSIILELTVEQSRMVDPPMPEGAERPAFSPAKSITVTSKSTVRVPAGKAVLAGGKRATGKDAGQTWIVVTAKETK